MTNEYAELVTQARDVLKAWNGKSAIGEVIRSIRNALAPLVACSDELSAEAREKLHEVNVMLDRLGDALLTAEQREALDTLMLGLWIRIELLSETSQRRE